MLIGKKFMVFHCHVAGCYALLRQFKGKLEEMQADHECRYRFPLPVE